MGPEVWVDGRPLSSITKAWGELEVTHRWPYGSWEAKWSMPLEPWKRPAQLHTLADVQVKIGPYCIWCGNLAEPNWSDGTFAALGAAREGEGALALNNTTGQTTSIPDVAVDDAIARGLLRWTRPASISAVALGADDQTDALNYVTPLLDAFAESVSKRWYIDAFRDLRLAVDPTVPSALLLPDNGVLGVAVEAQVGTVVGRYLDSTTHTLATVAYGSGAPEKGVSWVDRGEMSAAAATALCQGVWAPLQAQPGWTNGLTIRPGELRSIGGRQIPLWRFQAGPTGMLKLLGVRDLRGLSANTNIVAGETILAFGVDANLRVNPVGKVARDIRSQAEGSGGTVLG